VKRLHPPLLLLGMILTSTLSFNALEPPPLKAARSLGFSWDRAKRDLAQIAARPHPMGSEQNAKSGAYIHSTLSSLDLEVQVQKTSVVSQKFNCAGFVTNILARTTGLRDVPAILLATHYDSRPVAPGASDAGSGVVTLLEIARKVSKRKLSRPVIFLFTDGEEDGLLGAQAFVNDHPWKQDVGLVMNFEARGSCGPALMFETSAGNADLISDLAHAVPSPMATSLAHDVYKRMPNDTDFTIFKKAGLKGFNFAYNMGWQFYHSPMDDIRHIDPRSVGHHFLYGLSLVDWYQSHEIPTTCSTDAVYFNPVGYWLIRYPRLLDFALLTLAFAFWTSLTMQGLRREADKLRFTSLLSTSVLCGTGLCLSVLLSSSFVRGVSGAPAWIMHSGDLQRSAPMAVSMCLLQLFLGIGLVLALDIRFSCRTVSLGVISIDLILSIVTMRLLPGGSYLFLIPALFTLGLLHTLDVPEPELRRVFVALTLAAPILSITTGILKLLFTSLGLSKLGAPLIGALVFHTTLRLSPILRLIVMKRQALFMSLLGSGCTLGLVLSCRNHGFSQEYPQENRITYLLIPQREKAWWFSPFDASRDPWLQQFLSDEPSYGVLPYPPVSLEDKSFYYYPAPPLKVMPPVLEILDESMVPNAPDPLHARRIRVKAYSLRGAREISLAVVDKAKRIVSIDGRRLITGKKSTASEQQEDPGWAWIHVYNPPREGTIFEVDAPAEGPVRVALMDVSSGLSDLEAISVRPRKADQVPRYDGDRVAIITYFDL